MNTSAQTTVREIVVNATIMTPEAVVMMFHRKGNNNKTSVMHFFYGLYFSYREYSSYPEFDENCYRKAVAEGDVVMLDGQPTEFVAAKTPDGSVVVVDPADDTALTHWYEPSDPDLIALLREYGSVFVFGHECARVEQVMVSRQQDVRLNGVFPDQWVSVRSA